MKQIIYFQKQAFIYLPFIFAIEERKP